MIDCQAPAAAYLEMVGLVGDVYLTRPAPPRGKVLLVEGVDHVKTEWCFTDAHGHEVSELVRNHPRLRLVAMRRFPAADVT